MGTLCKSVFTNSQTGRRVKRNNGTHQRHVPGRYACLILVDHVALVNYLDTDEEEVVSWVNRPC